MMTVEPEQQKQPTTLEYPYKASATGSLIIAVICGLVAAVAGYYGLHNVKDLDIGYIVIGPYNASLIYKGAAILFGVVGLVNLISYFAVYTSGRKRVIRLTEKDLQMPHGGTTKVITIPFGFITGIQQVKYKGESSLRIYHRGGQTDIAKSVLRDEHAYIEILNFIANKVRKNQS